MPELENINAVVEWVRAWATKDRSGHGSVLDALNEVVGGEHADAGDELVEMLDELSQRGAGTTNGCREWLMTQSVSRGALFWLWLQNPNQLQRSDAIGDFARDARSDEWSIKACATQEEWFAHLGGMNACENAINAIDAAWTEFYKQWRGGDA